MTPRAKSERVKALARAGGFDRVGITRPAPSVRAAYYRHWLASGQMGTMGYLTEHADVRENPERMLPGARSVVCVAVNYRHPDAAAAGTGGEREPCGRIAQYARGEDYHRVLHDMLRGLVRAMRAEFDKPFEARTCTDTAPVFERELAAAAGLGWVGKNTLLLHEREGSYCVLGELFTTLELTPDAPATDHCGTCTRCLDACPTAAFPAAYQMDARRCIAYLTIEHRGEIPAEQHERIGDWLFGCDICQDVCPFNARAAHATQPRIAAARLPGRLPLRPLVALTSGAHRRLTRGSATRRASRRMWQRNARIALANATRTPG